MTDLERETLEAMVAGGIAVCDQGIEHWRNSTAKDAAEKVARWQERRRYIPVIARLYRETAG